MIEMNQGPVRKALRSIEFIFDFLFPSRCPTCDTLVPEGEDHGFCQKCFPDIKLIEQPICFVCGQPFGIMGNEPETDSSGIKESQVSSAQLRDHLCGDCIKKSHSFDLARSATIYRGKIREAIQFFKFSNMPEFSRPLAKIMISNRIVTETFSDLDTIIPVPLHKERLKQRGYNQALLLACEIKKEYALELQGHNLRRTRHTLPQVGLGKKERRKNVKGAFEVHKPEKIRGKKILLVDDVYTTGNTLNECARVLKKAGAKKVTAITVARVSIIDFD
ncbi:MAG: ComF family protein [Deltaproteobacteria bacterium]|nr:MAG: ComF family protein [Deltaproteobacteria bacterium]